MSILNIPRVNIMVETGCCTCHKSIVIPASNGGCGCSRSYTVSDMTPNAPCVECEDVCDDDFPSDCGYYSGADIPILGIKKGDKLTKIIVTLATEIIALKARVVLVEDENESPD